MRTRAATIYPAPSIAPAWWPWPRLSPSICTLTVMSHGSAHGVQGSAVLYCLDRRECARGYGLHRLETCILPCIFPCPVDQPLPCAPSGALGRCFNLLGHFHYPQPKQPKFFGRCPQGRRKVFEGLHLQFGGRLRFLNGFDHIGQHGLPRDDRLYRLHNRHRRHPGRFRCHPSSSLPSPPWSPWSLLVAAVVATLVTPVATLFASVAVVVASVADRRRRRRRFRRRRRRSSTMFRQAVQSQSPPGIRAGCTRIAPCASKNARASSPRPSRSALNDLREALCSVE